VAVLPLDMVENLTSPCERISGWMFVMGQSGQATFSWKKAPSDDFCSHVHRPPHGMILHPHLA
jgi:hypothetical protein